MSRVKVKNIGMMTEREQDAHLHAPCPVCGKLNTPYSYEGTILGKTKYHYSCMDTSLLTGRDLRDWVNLKGCDVKWSLKVDKDEFKKENLQLDETMVDQLEGWCIPVDLDLYEIIKDKQSNYWNNLYHNKKHGKPFYIEWYLSFLKWIIRMCNK